MELVRIGELARRSGVPMATLKFYLREGLISPVRKSGRTMSWYDPALVDRLRAIKDLQQEQFLPLDVIRQTLEGERQAPDDLAAADAIAKVLAKHAPSRSRSRAEVLAGGASEAELAWLAATKLVVPDADTRYSGDDLALLSTLSAARHAGLAAEMLPFEILRDYVIALNKLVAVELQLFRVGVLGRVGVDTVKLTTVATELSERLVVLIRRKLLLPTLERLLQERTDAPTQPAIRPPRRHRRMRQLKPQPATTRRGRRSR